MDADPMTGQRSCAEGRTHGPDTKLIRDRFVAVVFDLFGTLPDASDPLQPESVSLDVAQLLGTLKKTGLKIGALSDAVPEVADSWHTCELAAFVDNALFSCCAALLKQARWLYTAMTSALDITPGRTLYCGDGCGELRGAELAGFAAVQVGLRGSKSARAYGYKPWSGPSIADVEMLPALMLDDRREGGPLRA